MLNARACDWDKIFLKFPGSSGSRSPHSSRVCDTELTSANKRPVLRPIRSHDATSSLLLASAHSELLPRVRGDQQPRVYRQNRRGEERHHLGQCDGGHHPWRLVRQTRINISRFIIFDFSRYGILEMPGIFTESMCPTLRYNSCLQCRIMK